MATSFLQLVSFLYHWRRVVCSKKHWDLVFVLCSALWLVFISIVKMHSMNFWRVKPSWIKLRTASSYFKHSHLHFIKMVCQKYSNERNIHGNSKRSVLKFKPHCQNRNIFSKPNHKSIKCAKLFRFYPEFHPIKVWPSLNSVTEIQWTR